VQDDEETKHDLISKIDVLYTGAVAMIVTLVCKDANSDIAGVRRRTRILGPGASRMVPSGSRKTHPSTSRLRILHTKAERGHARYGRAAQEAIYLFEWPVFELGPGTRTGTRMGAGV